ncbi:amino acid ABC transporter substrate-binding protein [Falsiroseomonas tokyonensis]|uniref:Amino acid ABC transporter substrate-binding protein n=1 Tax=Falsiroseomonas tokyonensis TaxID=430521 RepID=A0ABV7C3T5_9PROT|nr:amino acid ABC transporter substrate-binding protein [Falsiroseomonas tokyonensis]MBU8541554.1 amino acid ABC transporter substrate-binding protein [Falsiroseomonas tokyonensis]
MITRTLATAGLLLSLALPALAQTMASPGPTLTAVRAKGALDCGAHPGAPGFGVMDSRGVYSGLDGDTCRAIAAAVFGDAARARFVVVTSAARLPALQSGQIDVLPRTTTWTQSRDTANGLNFTAVNFYDGQGFLLRTSLGVTRATQLDGATFCVTSGTTNELNLADWARSNRLNIRPVVFEQNDETRIAYQSGRCDVFTTDASQLAGIRSALQNPSEHVVLPDIISKEPLAVAVRHGDDQWFDIVRWTIFALIEAEELGVTQANVEEMLSSPRPEIRRLLGVSGDHGPFMGLDRRWAYNALKAVGNYGEIFERHLGRNTPVGLARGVNDLWTRGGLMYAPPIR